MTSPTGVVVNTRSLQRRFSGVERYTDEMVRCLQGRLRCESPDRASSGLVGHLWEQLVLPTRIKSGELLWSPANTGPLLVEKQVLTLHDVSVLENPQWYRAGFARWYRWLLPRLVWQVRLVLTVSEHSSQRILETLKLPVDRVRVVPCGVNLEKFRPAGDVEISRLRKVYNLSKDYLLFLGTHELRKNLSRLLQAWTLIQADFPQVELVIAGDRKASFAAWQQPPEQPGVRYIGYIPDASLRALYSGAKLFLLPSLSEGFGLPVLEAMACGTPVLAADSGALPEVVGCAGRLIHPLIVEDWAYEIAAFLSDPDRVREYRRRGLERACEFAWENSAAQLWNLLEEAHRGEDAVHD